MISSRSPFQSLCRSSKSLRRRLKGIGYSVHPEQVKPESVKQESEPVYPLENAAKQDSLGPSGLKTNKVSESSFENMDPEATTAQPGDPTKPTSARDIISKWRARATSRQEPSDEGVSKTGIKTPVVPSRSITKPASKVTPEATRPNDTAIGEPLLENEQFDQVTYFPQWKDKKTGKMVSAKKSNGKLQIPTAVGMINISSITSQKRGLRLTETIMLNPQGEKWDSLPNLDPWDREDIVALLNRAKIDRARAKELANSTDEFTPGEIRKAVEEGTMKKSDGDRTLKEMGQRKIAQEIMVKLRESETKRPRVLGRYSYTPESLVVRLTEIYGGDKGKAEEMVDKLIGAAS